MIYYLGISYFWSNKYTKKIFFTIIYYDITNKVAYFFKYFHLLIY